MNFVTIHCSPVVKVLASGCIFQHSTFPGESGDSGPPPASGLRQRLHKPLETTPETLYASEVTHMPCFRQFWLCYCALFVYKTSVLPFPAAEFTAQQHSQWYSETPDYLFTSGVDRTLIFVTVLF